MSSARPCLSRLRGALALCSALGFASLLAGACGDATRSPRVAVVRAPVDGGIDSASAQWTPRGIVERATLVTPTRLELALSSEEGFRLTALGACPVDVAAGGAPPPIELRPRLELRTEKAIVGYGARFEVAATKNCADDAPASIEWRPIDGAAVSLQASEAGARVVGTAPTFAATHPEPIRFGIVPISPRTRGAFALEATMHLPGGSDVRRTIRLAAAHRSTGLPTLSVGQRVFLAGDDWHTVKGPPGSAAAPQALASAGDRAMATFEPDVAGRWTLADARGRELSLSAGRHDWMPLDCGRSDCHAAVAVAAEKSPMTHVLRRGLEGELGATYDAHCAIECHVAGDAALGDGFVGLSAALGYDLPAHPDRGVWDALPSALRRLGGVGCTACHGPSALPEPSARWRILRADTCAFCHDAPPRYGHVAAWRTSRMSRSDESPKTRDGSCSACHTTAGFLASIGVRPRRANDDPDEGSVGVTCAACHAAHGAAVGKALVRRIDPPSSLCGEPAAAVAGAEGPSGVCFHCHAPESGGASERAAPSASAAALFLGRGGVAGETGESMPGPFPHGTVTNGCIGCHAAGPQGQALERGAGHAFRPDLAKCGGCHGGAVPEERPDAAGHRVAERARALWDRLVERGIVRARPSGGAPPHADPAAPASKTGPLERAALDVLLVLEDPAAGVHNAPYARALLDEAERALGGERAKSPGR